MADNDTVDYFDLITIGEVMRLTSMARSTVYKRMDQDAGVPYDATFPLPIKIGPRHIRWERSKINKWMQNKIDKNE